ncbi:MAG: bifunctional oligoribonuclease/PAP phosphatase NrnA [Bacteroidales bacterium]|nr:bifunctional oligoribonuclease/PAP phosphatase NrnA [Bacteroidales bacterium]
MSTISPDKIKRFNELLDCSERIAIITHTNPDGDAIGSCSALMHYLRTNRKKNALTVLPTPYPDSLAFLAEDEGITVFGDGSTEDTITGCDLLVCLDFNDFSRISTLEEPVRSCKAPKVLIDHHLNPSEDCFDICFSETGISSASELLYQVLLNLPDIQGDASALPMSSLRALMAGMTTDTNNFANSVYPSTLKMAADLLSAGVDRDYIISRLYNEYRENRVRAMAALLKDHLKILDNGTAYVIAFRDLLDEFDIREGELEGLVNIPLSIGKVNMSILLKEDEDYFRVSIRSKKGFSANRMAREHFNGGGHEQAAGGRLYFPKDIKSPEYAEEYIKKVAR